MGRLWECPLGRLVEMRNKGPREHPSYPHSVTAERNGYKGGMTTSRFFPVLLGPRVIDPQFHISLSYWLLADSRPCDLSLPYSRGRPFQCQRSGSSQG